MRHALPAFQVSRTRNADLGRVVATRATAVKSHDVTARAVALHVWRPHMGFARRGVVIQNRAFELQVRQLGPVAYGMNEGAFDIGVKRLVIEYSEHMPASIATLNQRMIIGVEGPTRQRTGVKDSRGRPLRQRRRHLVRIVKADFVITFGPNRC